MHRRAWTIAALALAVAWPAFAQRVERVIDGDTLVVAGIGTVRLIGVDTPETVDPRRPVEHFGKEASAFTRRTAQGQTVRLEYDIDRTDRYRRTLAYVYLPDGRMLNAEIIRQGYGHAYARFPFRYLEQFRGYEREAREAGRGLWANTPRAPASIDASEDRIDQIVFITRTGDRYHRAGCRHLARSAIAIPLADVTRHTPCSICKPVRR